MFRKVFTTVVLLLAVFSVTGSAAKRSRLIIKVRNPAALENLSKTYKFKLDKKISKDATATYVIDHPDTDALQASLEKDPNVEWVDKNERLTLVVPLASGETVLPLGPVYPAVSTLTVQQLIAQTMVPLSSGETVLPLGGETVLPLGGETVLPLGGETVLPLQEAAAIKAAYLKMSKMLTANPRLLIQGAFWKIGLYDSISKATGKGVMVVNLDTGIDTCHDVMKGVQTRSFVDEPLTPENCATASTPRVPGFGHGTAVASLIHMIAPEATLWSYRVFDSSGTADTSDVYEAIVAATDAGAKVINMSFGSKDYSSAMRDAIDYGSSRGVVFTAAAGNDGKQKLMVPAALDPVMAVASTNVNDVKSWFSNYHTKIFVSSPGESLWTAYPNFSMARVSGTSFASALVAGEVALYIDSYQRSHPRSPDSETVLNAVEGGVDAIDKVNDRQFREKLGSGRIDIMKTLSTR